MLGSTWMHNHEIIFDNHNKKIGFISSNCTKDNLIEASFNNTEIPVNPTKIVVENKPGDYIGFNNKSNIDKEENSYFFVVIFFGVFFIIFITIIILFAIRKFKRGEKFMWISLQDNSGNNYYFKYLHF